MSTQNKLYAIIINTLSPDSGKWLRACLPCDDGPGEHVHVFERDIFTHAAMLKMRPLADCESWRELITCPHPSNYARKVDIDPAGNVIVTDRKPYAFLRMGDDYLTDAKRYKSKTAAIAAYRETALELARYGQAIEASIHFAIYRDDLNEYPDFVLALGQRGGVQCTRA